MDQPPQIPIRTSSKRDKRKPEPTIADLELEKAQVQNKLDASSKRLKTSKSWDRRHYEDKAENESLAAEFQRVQFKLSFASLRQSAPETTMDAYMKTEEAKRMLMKERTSDSQAEIWTKQAELLNNSDGPSTASGLFSWWQNFMLSRWGLKMDGSHARRYNTQQGNVRTEVEKVYGAAHPNPKMLQHWCPISAAWHNTAATNVAHIYPVNQGVEAFEALFGSQVKDELMSPANCTILLKQVEKLHDEHRLALVPDVTDLSCEKEMTAWYKSEPAEYKIRIFDPNSEGMDAYVPERTITFAQLDRQKAVWRTNARLRKRYLWYHYACCVLKTMRSLPDAEKFQAEYEKKYWGSVGRWFKHEGYLIGAAKILGHDYKSLVLAADTPVDETQAADYSLIYSMNESLRHEEASPDEDEDSEEPFEGFGA